MPDNKLDLKDIQGIVEEGLKTTKSKWEEARAEDKKNFDAKVTSIISDIEAKGYMSKADVEKAVAEKTKEIDDAIVELKKKGLSDASPMGFKSAFSKALKENHEKFNSSDKIKGNVVVNTKDITYDGNFPGFEDWRTETSNNIIMKPRDTFRMRDIIPVGSMSGDTIKFPKEGDKTGTGPAPWGRESTIEATDPKPSFEPNMTVVSAAAEWIAGIIRLPVEMLADLPFLTSYLRDFGLNELLNAEDDQILNGNGTSPQLDGIIPNATTYNGSQTDILKVIYDAAYGTLGALNRNANGVILNPQDVVNALFETSLKDTPLQGAVSFVNGNLQMAGIPVYKTNKIDQGDFLIGDFTQAQLFQRLAPQVRFFEQDQDNVVKNLVTVRVEERVALAIYNANAFVTGTFTPTT